jgi:hypothetical protein
MDSSTKRLLAYSLTMMLLSLPSLAFAQAQTSATSPNLAGGETAAHEGANGDDTIYCRPPEQRPDSRMMGPKCRWPRLPTDAKWTWSWINGNVIWPEPTTLGLEGEPGRG